VFAQPPRVLAVQVLGVVAGAVVVAASLALAFRWRKRASPLWMFSFAWLVTTMISPIAWQHHYAPAVFAFVLIVRAVREDERLRAPRHVVPPAMAFVLMAGYFEVRGLHGVAARLLASYVLCGALVLAAMLAWFIELGAGAADHGDGEGGAIGVRR
jgi:hypothetical protein